MLCASSIKAIFVIVPLLGKLRHSWHSERKSKVKKVVPIRREPYFLYGDSRDDGNFFEGLVWAAVFFATGVGLLWLIVKVIKLLWLVWEVTK